MAKKRKLQTGKIIYTLMIIFLSIFFICGAGGVIFITSVLAEAPKLDVEKLDSKESSRILDANGELIADIGGESREKVTYEQMPQVLIDAFVAVEDSRFFDHNGFDLPRFMKSALVNLQTMSFEQGGSTFTMQIVKNSYFLPDGSGSAVKSVKRKLQEIYLAIQADKVLDKKEILELYINKINFGYNAFGVQKAAEYYFNKSVEDINLPEAALLAGIINLPNGYNPYVYLDAATERRDVVLNLMTYHGYITEADANLARAVKVEDLLAGGINTNGSYPFQSYIDAVVEEVVELTGKDPYEVPMVIYTHMNRDAQIKADELLDGKGVKYPANDELFQTAFSMVETKTGHIVAMGAGRNYRQERGFNRATSMYKQPGSTSKPLMSYSLAFDKLGWATSHVVEDKPITYRGTNRLLPNVDGKYLGEITLHEAMARSRNTTAMTTFEQLHDVIGRNALIEHIQKLGFRVTDATFDLGYSIGSSFFEVTPKQLASAYAVFANEGMYIKPTTISRIEFTTGEAPIETNYLPSRVISSEASYLTSVLLQGAVESEWYNYMQILKNPNYKVYAKTGTTDWGDEGKEYGIPYAAMKDKWVNAYTSEYSIAVWTGYDSAVKGKQTYFTQAKSELNIPVTIAKEMLFNIHKSNYPATIKQPAGVVDITHVLGAYPYAAPSGGIAESSIISGKIKKEFANLTSIAPQPVENLEAFIANYQQETNTLTFQFTPYPQLDRTFPATPTIQYELEHVLNGKKMTLTAEGRRLYDPKLYFGNVVYKVDLVYGNTLISSSTFNESMSSIPVPVLPSQDIQVCGYYALSIATGSQSNRTCVNVHIPNDFLPDPNPEDPWGTGSSSSTSGTVIDPFS